MCVNLVFTIVSFICTVPVLCGALLMFVLLFLFSFLFHFISSLPVTGTFQWVPPLERTSKSLGYLPQLLWLLSLPQFRLPLAVSISAIAVSRSPKLYPMCLTTSFAIIFTSIHFSSFARLCESSPSSLLGWVHARSVGTSLGRSGAGCENELTATELP